MKNRLIYTFLSLLCLLFTGCQDWLDVSPKSEVRADDLFSTEAGFRDALMGVYTVMNQKEMYGAFETCLMDCFGGLVQSCGNSSAYMLNMDLESATLRSGFASMWSQHYSCILNLNELLEYLEKADRSIFSPGVFELLKGEALALRGFLHLDLIRMWGPVSTAGNLGRPSVPYYRQAGVTAEPAQTLSDAIRMAIEDLEAGRAVLKEYDPILEEDWEHTTFVTSTTGTGITLTGDDYENLGFFLYRNYRMNYYAATAAIARAYHHVGQYTEAARYAREVIDSGKFPLLDSGETGSMGYWLMKEAMFQLYKRDFESEIAIKFYEKESTAVSTNNRLVLYRSAIFDKDAAIPRDWRAVYLFSGSQFIRFDNGSSAVPILRVSEMYLIAAEAENDFSYLNTLREHRGWEGIEYSHENDDLEEEIEVEYMREFLGEGQAYYYYKRTGKNQLLISPNRDHTVLFDLEYPDSELEFGNVISKEQESKES
ncbi:MAG: RagB/SusD family nutrient uptake outer membrane protein [Rikenellaceae bacterium]|nr:RagB/SusD family nutrient uptake outer membrane protein [Rikenellaceae bacterium]